MKIRYITAHGTAEWVEFDDDDRDTLTLSFEPYHNGALLLGGKMFPLKDGEVSIPMLSLNDGEYSPRLESEAGVYAVAGFSKQGRSISVSRADEGLIRRLLLRCYNLESDLVKLTDRVDKLELSCRGHQIFDFERKEK